MSYVLCCLIIYNYFNICYVTLPLHKCDITVIIILFLVEYLPNDDRKMPKRMVGFHTLFIILPNYSAVDVKNQVKYYKKSHYFISHMV